MGKQKFIPILAMMLLLIGIISTLYVYATQINKDTVTINGQEYTYEALSFLGGEKTIETVDGEVTGVSLENVVKSIVISCTSCGKYTIKAADGYQKTIEWDVFKTGVLSKESRVYFPNTPKALWVRDVVEIEVN